MQSTFSRLLPLAGMLLLVACGGGGTGGGNEVVVQQPPVDNGGNDIGGLVASSASGTWLSEGLVYADQDRDGIEDRFDAWPDTRTLFNDPTSDRPLKIVRAWSVIDGRTISNTAVEDHPLNLQVAGLPVNGAEPVWVVFQTEGGLRASRASIAPDGTLSVDPYADAQYMHIVVGASRGMDRRVYSQRLNQPLLFTPAGPVAAGTTLTLEGRHLDAAERVVLGDNTLPILAKTAATITVAIPEAASGKLLVVQSSIESSNFVSLDLRQNIEIRISDLLLLPQQDELRFWHDGSEYRVSSAQPVSISVPSYRPFIIAFDIVTGDEVRSYGHVRTVAWPGDDVVEITASSSLLGRMVNIRQWLPGTSGKKWQQVRNVIESVITTQTAQDYMVSLTEHTAARSGPPAEYLSSAVVGTYHEIAEQNLLAVKSGGAATVAAAPQTSWGSGLDDVIVSVLQYIDQDPDNKDSVQDASGGTVYPEGDTQVFSSDYSLVGIMRHEDTRLVTPGLNFNSGCAFSPAESQWFIDQNVESPFERVWKSDLCLQVDGVSFVSAAVIKPGFKSAGALLGQVAQGQKPPELVRRHSRATVLDFSYQFGKGGHYLRGDDGLPLCHMETCYIEMITSGYGAGRNIPLTDDQKALVETLRVRMWVDGIMPWIMGMMAPGDGDSDQGSFPVDDPGITDCIREDLLSDENFYTAFSEFDRSFKDHRDKRGAELLAAISTELDSKVWPWLKTYVNSELGDQIIKCIDGVSVVDQVTDRIRASVLRVPGLSAFTELVAFITNAGSVVLTPEKFIFKIEHRAEVESISPRTIDLFDDGATLSIEGDWLAQTDTNVPSPCSGDNWCPKLVFADKFGGFSGTKTVDLDASNITLGGSCGIGCARLTVPFTQLADLQDLVGGPLRVEVQIADGSYTSYPNNRLPVPVPGNVMRLKTLAKLQSVSPPHANPGDTVTIKGSGLSDFGASAVFELRPKIPGISGPVAMRRAENSPDSDNEVRLVVPNVSDNQYLISIIPDADAADTGLQPLDSDMSLFVTSGNRPLVVVADQGIVKDDFMQVDFLDVNGGKVRYLDNDREISFTLPTNEATRITFGIPENVYSVAVPWDDSPDTNSSSGLANVNEFVISVRIRCVAPGADNTCTFGLRSAREGLCVVKGSIPVPARTGKIRKGEVRDYYLTPRDSETGSFTDCSVVVP